METKEKLNIEQLKKQIEVLSDENQKLKNQIKENNASAVNPYRLLAEQSKDGVMIIKDNIIEYVNEGFMSLVEYKKEDVIGRSYGDFISSDLFEQLKDKTDKRIKGDEVPSIFTIDFISRNGKTIQCEINVTVVEYGKKPVLVVGIRDISELLKYKKKKKVMSSQEDYLKRSLSRFFIKIKMVYILGQIKFFVNVQELAAHN